MALFPDTPKSVLRCLAAARADSDEVAWERFSELYRPVIREFVRISSPSLQAADVEDVTQDVFVRLVNAFRRGAYDPAKAKFRTYLSALVRHNLIDRARRLAARMAPQKLVSIEEAAEVVAETPDAAVLADLNWRIARHQAAVAQVFAKSALGEKARRIYVLHQTEGLSPAEIAARLGEKANAVRSILSRVTRMIAAVEGAYE